MSMMRSLTRFRDLALELYDGIGVPVSVEIDVTMGSPAFRALADAEPHMVANAGVPGLEYLRFAEGGVMLNIFEELGTNLNQEVGLENEAEQTQVEV